MIEHPILFSAPMVRAILDGTKTQTRRVVMPKPPADCSILLVDTIYPVVIDRDGDDQPGPEKYGATTDDGRWCLPSPYGRPGDRLWVRETWQGPLFNEDQFEAYQLDRSAFETPEYCRYAADGFAPPEFFDADDNLRCRWRPSIHMFRWASRITLEITGVRVERLQDISDSDALAEGVDRTNTSITGYATERYKRLWESINGPGSWDANPWVWVVEFSVANTKEQ